jgi:pimeloyl-ACP methyl ester carboxylesterase
VEPLALALHQDAPRRAIFAPDTPGFGDSAALPVNPPTLIDYGNAFFEMWDQLGIERCDLYGFHTGAHIAIEMALAQPERIGKVIIDGLLWLDEQEKEQYLEHYAPVLTPDAQGTQIFRALQFIRDQAWFFPHFKRDADHNLGGGAMPPAVLHTLTIELLQAIETYHLGYQAVFRHDLAARLPLVRQPVLLTADASDPTRGSLTRAASVVGSSVIRQGLTDGRTGFGDKVQLISEFLTEECA